MSGRKLGFEIHITVSQTDADRSAEFAEICPRFGGKAVFIELARGEFPKQLMLSKTMSGDFPLALETARRDAESLDASGFRAERVKIETAKDNAGLFEKSARNYFEWHGKVELRDAEKLAAICRRHDAHLSRNSLKNDAARRFITIRESGAQEIFENRVRRLTTDLAESGWQITDRHAEFCVYDSNLSLDEGWMEK